MLYNESKYNIIALVDKANKSTKGKKSASAKVHLMSRIMKKPKT
jgi:hypothetical protein